MTDIQTLIDNIKSKLNNYNNIFSYEENKTNPYYLTIFDCYSLDNPHYLLFNIWIYHEYNDDSSRIKYTLTCHVCLEEEVSCPYISHEYDNYLDDHENVGIKEVFDLINQFLVVYKKYKNQSIVYNTEIKK